MATNGYNGWRKLCYSFNICLHLKMDYKAFEIALDEMILNNNYKMVAGYIDNKMIAVSGYWIARMLYCGRYLQACNLVCRQDTQIGGIEHHHVARLDRCQLRGAQGGGAGADLHVVAVDQRAQVPEGGAGLGQIAL